MNILSLSGGATRFAGIYSAAMTVLNKGFKPDLILGISSGALAALPLVLSMHDVCYKISTTLTLDTFFTKRPVNENGKTTFSAFWRIITGKNSLGLQDSRLLLSSVIDSGTFEHYKINSKYPAIIVGTVNFDTGLREYYNLKELSYKEMLNCVEASARIPAITQQMELSTGGCYDGGVYDHNLAANYIDTLRPNVKELVSIFARPKDFKVEYRTDWRDNLVKTITRLQELNNIETSKNDERLEISLSKELGFKCTQIFLPNILKSTYDTDNQRLKELWEKGIEVSNKIYKNEFNK